MNILYLTELQANLHLYFMSSAMQCPKARLSYNFGALSSPGLASGVRMFIMKTCPCNEHPLTPHFYIGKLGFTGVYIIFLFLL